MTAKAATPTPTAKPVGNKATEVIIGQAASKLSTAVKGIMDAQGEITKLADKADEYALIIVSQETKLSELEQEYKNRLNQARIELQQSLSADRARFVQEWLSENKLTTISNEELASLNSALVNAESNLEKEIKAAEARAFGIAKADKESALKIASLEHAQKEASNVAEISHLKNEVASLKAQVEMLTKQLDEQRKATVEVAKAGSIGTIQVGNTQERR
jgi:predicted  nucleic acid-binding Zn-ribbon protein